MKKIFSVIASVIAPIVAVLFGISLILPGVVDLSSTTDFSSMFGEIIQIATPQAVLLFLLFAFVGCALVLFGKNIVKYIGYACELSTGFFALFAVAEVFKTIGDNEMAVGVGAILAIVGLILTVIGAVLELLSVLVGGETGSKTAEEKKIETLLQYKKLLDQNIITEEIFIVKRNELLGISNGDNETING